MAPHSNTLAWKIPWTEEPGRLQSMGSQRVRHDWATSLSLFTFMHWRRKWQPTPVFLPGESQGRGAWWAAAFGVTQNQTQVKRLSNSSRTYFIPFNLDYNSVIDASLKFRYYIFQRINVLPKIRKWVYFRGQILNKFNECLNIDLISVGFFYCTPLWLKHYWDMWICLSDIYIFH